MRDDRCNMSRAPSGFYTPSGTDGESIIVSGSAPACHDGGPRHSSGADSRERMVGIAGKLPKTAAELLDPCGRPIVALDVHRLCKRR